MTKEEKQIENKEAAAEEPAAEEVANEDVALEQELADEERLPFPNARVVAHMKSSLDKEKMIRARVKKEMNEWLGEMCKRVAKDMNKSPYTVIEAGDFHRAIKKYEQLEEIAKQKERMLVYLDRIKQDCNMMIGEIERSFGIEGITVANPEKKVTEEQKE
ncbi:MAG: hypothetical protein ABIG20_05285 [archaeon]